MQWISVRFYEIRESADLVNDNLKLNIVFSDQKVESLISAGLSAALGRSKTDSKVAEKPILFYIIFSEK